MFGKPLLLIPRTYPQPFADHIRNLYPGLVTGAEGIPIVDVTQSPQKVFAGLPWSTWEEAKLLAPLKYLRGNKHLEVPENWLQVFPRALEILHRMEQRVAAEIQTNGSD